LVTPAEVSGIGRGVNTPGAHHLRYEALGRLGVRRKISRTVPVFLCRNPLGVHCPLAAVQEGVQTEVNLAPSPVPF
jgi:hypothetical protein